MITCRLTPPENQCKNTRLKNTYTIGKRDPFNNLGVPATEAGGS